MKIIRSFVLSFVVVIAMGGLFLFYKGKTNSETAESDSPSRGIGSIVQDTKREIVKKAAEKAIDSAIDKYAGEASSDVKAAIDNVSEEDKDKVVDIITDNMTIDSIDDVQSYISNNDMDGLMDYAQDKLTAEDYSELTGILEKYSNEILSEFGKSGN